MTTTSTKTLVHTSEDRTYGVRVVLDNETIIEFDVLADFLADAVVHALGVLRNDLFHVASMRYQSIDVRLGTTKGWKS